MLLPGSKTNRTQRTRLLRDDGEFRTGFGEGLDKVSPKSVKRSYRNGEKEGGVLAEGGGFRHEWTVQSSRRVANLWARERILPTGQWEGGSTRFGNVVVFREGGVFLAGDVATLQHFRILYNERR